MPACRVQPVRPALHAGIDASGDELPGLLALIEGDLPSGRYAARALAGAPVEVTLVDARTRASLLRAPGPGGGPVRRPLPGRLGAIALTGDLAFVPRLLWTGGLGLRAVMPVAVTASKSLMVTTRYRHKTRGSM